ncbi:hypothetical protein M413DRAFT_448908 [Hebeloma cylindrosporum]|uniref:BTB domain-containing protein n=1 Tax=Hebeloma cylindrosporum TaxID=76867 RepID=A0A0C3BJ76_HEBCY|nr:hypothetical protein M413DRAFT_448908 [Hebeloma cylindrosporum h7]
MSTEDNLRPLKRHAEYYIPTGDLFILVDEIQFRVHRYFFERESTYFQDRLEVPASPGAKLLGSDDSTAIKLNDLSPEEFAKFLWVFYNKTYSLYDAPVEDWEIILTLSNKWRFPGVKDLAIRELEKKTMSDVKRIKLYTANLVDRNYLIRCYAALCEREEPLTAEEGEDLGMKDVIRIAAAREQARASRLPSGARSPLTATIHGPDLHEVIREVFQIASVEVMTSTTDQTTNITGALTTQPTPQPTRKPPQKVTKKPTGQITKPGQPPTTATSPKLEVTPTPPTPTTKTAQVLAPQPPTKETTPTPPPPPPKEEKEATKATTATPPPTTTTATTTTAAAANLTETTSEVENGVPAQQQKAEEVSGTGPKTDAPPPPPATGSTEVDHLLGNASITDSNVTGQAPPTDPSSPVSPSPDGPFAGLMSMPPSSSSRFSSVFGQASSGLPSFFDELSTWSQDNNRL